MTPFSTPRDAGEELPEPPAALADLTSLAEKNDLRHGYTGERSFIQLREDTFGRSQDADQTAPTPLPICIRAFREGLLDLYQPAISYDNDANIYLSVITERLEAIEPELDDIRDQVVEAWKRARAAELALEHAQKLAEEVEDSGRSLRENFVESETQGVVVTDPFSFLEITNISPTTGQVLLQ